MLRDKRKKYIEIKRNRCPERGSGKYRTAAQMLLRLVYPARCPLCDQILPVGKTAICRTCREKLPWVRQPYCMKCGKMLDSFRKEFCDDCMTHAHRFDQGYAVFQYTGKMRASVQRMKFQNRREYLDFYAEAMYEQGKDLVRLWNPEIIIPVPMHWKKKNQRGFNQSELLARKFGKLSGIPVRTHIIVKQRETSDQKTLNRDERRKNLAGAFSLRGSLDGISCVLIIDDVYTTGSTVDELAQVLKNCGIKRVYFLAICTGKGKNIVCID